MTDVLQLYQHITYTQHQTLHQTLHFNYVQLFHLALLEPDY